MPVELTDKTALTVPSALEKESDQVSVLSLDAAAAIGVIRMADKSATHQSPMPM